MAGRGGDVMYHFQRQSIVGKVLDVQHRDLPDDAAAIAWMGNEVTAQLEELLGFRDGETAPFARREFSQDVEVLR